MKKQLALLLVTVLIGTVSFAQKDTKQGRLPVEGQFIVIQKIFKPVTITNSIQDIRFEGKRTHAIGFGYCQDFTLTKNYAEQGYLQLHTALYGTSATIKYDATLPAASHSLDSDVTWNFQRHAVALEGYLGISYNTPIKDRLLLRFGFGVNLQDVFVNSNMLRVRALVTANGVTSEEQIVGVNDQFFGFPESTRQEQDVHFNPVYTIGIKRKLENNRSFVADLRICSSAQPMRTPFELNFGSSGEFRYHKGYVGISLGLTIPYNQDLVLE